MNVGLIACSASKKGKNNPEQKYLAQDIYLGNTFRISKEIGLKKYNCEDWWILSAEHKLLNKDKEICYYDRYLHTEPASYKKEWATTVINGLKKNFDLSKDVFYIFGGRDYYMDLLPYIHCFVFNYKSCNTINLEEPIEYVYGVRK